MARSFESVRSVTFAAICFGFLGLGCGGDQTTAPAPASPPEPGKMEPGGASAGKVADPAKTEAAPK